MTMAGFMRSPPLALLGTAVIGWAALRSGYLLWLASAVVLPVPPAELMPLALDPWSAPVFDAPADDWTAAIISAPQRAAQQLSPAHRRTGHFPASLATVALMTRPDVGSQATAPSPDSEHPVIMGNRLLLRRMLAFRPANQDRAGLMTAIVRPAGGIEVFSPARTPATNRWSLSAWMLGRPGGGAGTLGRTGLSGSQMGVRLTWRPGDGPVTAFVRVNSAGRLLDGAELAVGASVRPVRAVPAELVVERRVDLTGPGRDAFAAYAAGGGTVALSPDNWRLDGYGAAGVVGACRRDVFAEGAVRVDRPVARLGALTLRAGGGVWAATQPGVSRVDAGPSIVALPTDRGAASVSVDWRQRLSGNAAPASGPAVTVALNF
jgi:hypothetical protein